MILDLIVIGIVLLSIYWGYKKGLASLIIKLCAFIIAIVITTILYRPITNFIIENTTIDETMRDMIIEKTMHSSSKEESNDITKELIEDAKNGMIQETAGDLSINIISGIVLLSLFIIVRIGLTFLSTLANTLTTLPIVKQFNQLGRNYNTDF